ncbi:NHL domain-containing thioredoxin family protein [Brevibacterium sp. BRM-1]|uniref:NHL domain-containing thioredoxin family protein n=1 Tax=Brevibacterium sp. BRM-1 TaxID=2999062 RepID=UPI00227FB3A3|nr:NHL domain-containing thioredoxin family protein [Brevibacterium sp. BRM-1]WAL39725.1 NHL domain-containing thioredoxin family protein [Brevibacterium sp. BRM-1]
MSESAPSPARGGAPRLHAPQLTGRRWINTGGRELSLADLRGKVVLLDFWTFCCINCLHVLDELRPIEEKYRDELVIIGVHSPKFEFERTVEAVDQAVERYQVEHIVLDDPDLVTWQAYTARAWPTLAVIDPEGYLVASMSGEGHSAGLAGLIEDLIAEHAAKGTLHRGDGPYVPPEPVEGELRFPGKVIRLTAPGHEGNLLVADSGHHSYAEYDPSGARLLQRIGSGERGRADGDFAAARFAEPGGAVELPPELAQRVGYDLVAADTVNHLLRGISLTAGTVSTVAGTGEQYMIGASDNVAGRSGEAGRYSGAARAVKLSSPWDLAFSQPTAEVLVAMAGNHTIWSFDPAAGTIRQFAGTMNEGLVDGGPEEAWFAQTSGLAPAADGSLIVADSETSALRRLDPATGEVTTYVGTGLFDFGFQDGPAEQARFQHPLGAAELPDGSIAVADTYNGAIRRYDPATGEVGTLARGLAEPSDLLVVGEADGLPAHLLVVESAAHRLTAVAIADQLARVTEGAQQTSRPATRIGTGSVRVRVHFDVPRGQKLDDRWGDPTYLQVSATPPELIAAGAGGSEGIDRTIELAEGFDSGVLHITARAAACDGEPGGEIPLHAACHLYQQDWGIPVELGADGPAVLDLDLRGAGG